MNPELLQSISFLQNLPPEEVHRFGTLLTEKEAPRGTQIVVEGEPIKAFHIVCAGTVHVRRLASGREMLLGRIERGGFFGEINLYDPATATASVYAADQVTLALIDYATFRSFLETNPAAGYQIVSSLMAEMARRLRQTDARLVNSVFWGGAKE